MHDPEPIRPPRLLRRTWLVAGALLVVAACQAVFGTGKPSGPVFPHQVHIEQGLDCTVCHVGAADQAQAGMPPSLDGCKLCHESIDEEKPPEKTVEAFLVDGQPRWLQREKPPTDVFFDHSAHANAGVECVTCHQPQVEGKGEGLHIQGGKATCMACHAKWEGGNRCSVCHTEIRADQPPATHATGWLRQHGWHAKDVIEGTGRTTCSMCHDETTCIQCHQIEPPRNHTNVWRLHGHALTASIDRDSCTTCHTTASCLRCHTTMQPRSHRGAWGPPANRHCNTCHLPASQSLGCGVCHLQFPRHPQGPPTPGNMIHQTASSPVQCLECHIALPHPNPGGDCRFCHR